MLKPHPIEDREGLVTRIYMFGVCMWNAIISTKKMLGNCSRHYKLIYRPQGGSQGGGFGC